MNSYWIKEGSVSLPAPVVWLIALLLNHISGSLESRVMATTVPPALAYAQNPRSQVVVSNTSASFSVTPTGTQPFAYQWLLEGEAIAGATNRLLSIAKSQPAQEGWYQAVIRNDYGAVTSLVANLSVIPPATNMIARIFTNAANAKLPYRIFVPTSLEPGTQYPLVLFLHGIGERGTDNLLQVRANPQFMSFVSYRCQTNAPLFLVAPQCPTTRTWSDSIMVPMLADLVDALIQAYPVDTNRLIVTGLSMGGYGSWALLDYRPDFLAAAVPVCGGGNVARCARFRHVPVWNFHAADDGSVPISESRTMINGLRQVGGQPIYTEYRSGGHGIWGNAYATPGLIEWTLAQRRGQPSPVDPQLQITSPTSADIWKTGANQLALAGTATWGSELLSQITWTNLALKAGGLAEGTTSWVVKAADIQPGQTSRLIVLASTYSFAPALAGTTTFSDTLEIQPVPPIFLSLAWQNEELTLHWIGGKGPFELQTRSNSSSGEWTTLAQDATAPWTIPTTGDAAFFRVIGH